MSANEQRKCPWGISLAIFSVGCLAPSAASRGYPLYQVPGDRLAVSQVATLSTAVGLGPMPRGPAIFIKKVDGEEVSELGATFELLPGCHVVEAELPMQGRGQALLNTPSQVAVAFPMKAGHAYTVLVDFLESGLEGRKRRLYGVEQDPRWQRTAAFQAVTPENAAGLCASWVNRPASGL